MNDSTRIEALAKYYDSANATPNTESRQLVGPMKRCRSKTYYGFRNTLPLDILLTEDLLTFLQSQQHDQ